MASRSTRHARPSEDENQNCAVQTATETTTSTAASLKNKAVEIGQDAADKIDEKREPVADAVESSATKLYASAGGLPGGEKVANLAYNKLQDTADYLREHDVRAAANDVQRFVKNHWVESLAVAAGIGFLLGRAFRRGKH